MSENNDSNRHILDKLKAFFWWALIIAFGIAGGVTILFAVLSVMLDHPLAFIEKTSNSIFCHLNDKQKLTLNEWFAIREMIQNGKLLTADQLLSNLSTFYTNVITFLVAFIGFIAFFSYLYIRVQSNEKMDELIEKNVSKHGNHFFTSLDFDEKMARKVESKGKQYHGLIEGDLDDAQKRIEALETRIQKLEGRLNKDDENLEETAESTVLKE